MMCPCQLVVAAATQAREAKEAVGFWVICSCGREGGRERERERHTERQRERERGKAERYKERERESWRKKRMLCCRHGTLNPHCPYQAFLEGCSTSPHRFDANQHSHSISFGRSIMILTYSCIVLVTVGPIGDMFGFVPRLLVRSTSRRRWDKYAGFRTTPVEAHILEVCDGSS